MRAVDTNLLVRLIIRDDPVQTKAAEMFIEGGAWVSLLALAEAAWVLAGIYKLSPHELAKSIEMLLEERKTILQESEAVAAALELFREKPGLGFSDCLILELARNAGHLPLGTFDKNLARVSGTQKL
jgi:predicted nucleic-acid-binding protein